MKTEEEKALARAYIRNRRLDKHYREQEHAYYQEWYKKNGRNRSGDYAECILEWRQEHPDRNKIAKAVARAVNSGQIVKPIICESCGRRTRLSGHHEDYTELLKVVWLCSSCHKLRHPTMT